MAPPNEIPTMLADLGVMMRAEVAEIVESCMSKTHNTIKAEVVKTVAEAFVHVIQTSYPDSSETKIVHFQ